MKKLGFLCLAVFLFACSKKIDKQATSPNYSSSKRVTEKVSCDFGMTSFNLTKRAAVNNQDIETLRRKKPFNGGGGNGNGGGSGTGGGTTDGGGTTTPPPSPGSGVIFLDFDGQLVSGTVWNSTGDFYCAPANLTAGEISLVAQRVINDYSPFNVTVTTDESVYNAANVYSRVRVVITESWEWYGKQVGGVSYIGSFTSGGNTPSFVFSSLLSYNSKFIAEAVSHEAGHSFGLRHQALYDANCVKISDYNYGQGTGEIGWAPIMGSAYSQNLSLWHNGPNSSGCSAIQDDVATIASIIGYRADDYPNSFSGAAVLTGSLDGTISSPYDADFFSVSTSSIRTVSVIPYNVGLNNAGANTDLVLNLYSSLGILIAAIENPTVLNAAVTLSPGSYYISVSTTANSFVATYGMLGKYNISLN
jgi:hypothetical protein